MFVCLFIKAAWTHTTYTYTPYKPTPQHTHTVKPFTPTHTHSKHVNHDIMSSQRFSQGERLNYVVTDPRSLTHSFAIRAQWIPAVSYWDIPTASWRKRRIHTWKTCSVRKWTDDGWCWRVKNDRFDSSAFSGSFFCFLLKSCEILQVLTC